MRSARVMLLVLSATCLLLCGRFAGAEKSGLVCGNPSTGLLIVDVLTVTRSGFNRGSRYLMPKVVAQDAFGRRDTVALARSRRAAFVVRPGRVVVWLTSSPCWIGLGGVRDTLLVGVGMAATDTIRIACSVPSDPRRDSVYKKMGIDSLSPLWP